MAGDPWIFNVTPAVPNGSIVITDGTTSVDISPMTPIGDAYSTSAFISGTSVSLEFYDDSYPNIGFTPQTATVGGTSTVNFLPTVMYAWSSDNSGTYPSTLYIWTTDVTADLTDIPYWANYQNGTADDVTIRILDGNPVWTGADEFEVNGVIYTRDSSKDVVTTTQTVANLSDGTNTYEIEDSQARADIREIQGNYVTTDTAQTISGRKTLTDELFISRIGSDFIAAIQQAMTLGSAPASNVDSGYTIFDSNNDWAAAFKHVYESGGLVKSQMIVRKQDKTASTRIEVGFKANGDEFTRAPSCADVGSIVTTTGMSKGTNGYVKLGNGIIIQWGDHSTTSAGASTITFPTAFTNNNYSIVVTRVAGTSTTNESGSYYFRGRTTTSVGVYKTNNNTQAMMWIAVGY